MLVISHVLIAVSRGHASFAHNDDAGGTTVHTQTTAGTHVFVDHEDHMIIGVGAR